VATKGSYTPVIGGRRGRVLAVMPTSRRAEAFTRTVTRTVSPGPTVTTSDAAFP
jgi:hypothetical protein